MSQIFSMSIFTIALCVVVSGCVETSCVTVAHRPIPSYPSATREVPKYANVVVYPASQEGSAEARSMLSSGQVALLNAMNTAGFNVVSSEVNDLKRINVCIVELAECRHDMPEWSSDGDASIVTVVAVRVRRPGAMKDGRMECGLVRSFQGVYRLELGRRTVDFQLVDEEIDLGIKGAVANLVGLSSFRDAIETCGKSSADFGSVPGGMGHERKTNERKDK